MTKPLEVGDMIYIRYLDHLLFRNLDLHAAKPITQEAWGRLEYNGPDYIRLVVGRYQEPSNDGKRRTKGTGFVILRKNILEIRPIG